MIEITYILLAVIVLVVLIDLYLKKKKESAGNKDVEKVFEKKESKKKEHDLKFNLSTILVFIIILAIPLTLLNLDTLDEWGYLVDVDEIYDEYIDWENKEFTVSRWYPECSNPELSKFKYTIELKYEDEKVLYKLAIVSNSSRVPDITEVECYNLGSMKRSFLLIDEGGYLLHKLTSQNFKLTSARLPLEYYDFDKGEYYIDRGEFYMSRNSFKKIKDFEKE